MKYCCLHWRSFEKEFLRIALELHQTYPKFCAKNPSGFPKLLLFPTWNFPPPSWRLYSHQHHPISNFCCGNGWRFVGFRYFKKFNRQTRFCYYCLAISFGHQTFKLSHLIYVVLNWNKMLSLSYCTPIIFLANSVANLKYRRLDLMFNLRKMPNNSSCQSATY